MASIYRPAILLYASSFNRIFSNVITRHCHKQLSADVINNKLVALNPLEIATGLYTTEIIDRISRSDRDDPYSVKMIEHGLGTLEQPNMIPSAYECRMVGCVCEEDSETIVWMWLHKGEPKKCMCGFWFKLYYKPPLADIMPYATKKNTKRITS